LPGIGVDIGLESAMTSLWSKSFMYLACKNNNDPLDKCLSGFPRNNPEALIPLEQFLFSVFYEILNQ
jgi:hypothetical protein